MKVSIIIPAHNAQETIGEALHSLQRQTFSDWEAIVVNDGSTDNTASIAGKVAEQDSRVRVISQPQRGEPAARNTGINHARFDWLLFLDADDWILPEYLERFARKFESDPGLDAVHCGWARVTPDGNPTFEKFGPSPDETFSVSANYCPWAVHACIVRRSLVEAAGKFDESLRTCSDWDLWQRIARAGARFGIIPEVLARYRMRPDSAGTSGRQLLTDGLRVINRGHSADPRVPHAHSVYRNGQPQDQLSLARLYWVCWAAGPLLGRGEDARHLLDSVQEDRSPSLDPWRIAERIFEAALLPTCKAPQEWPELYPFVEQHWIEFLLALESQSKTEGLARRAARVLEHLITKHMIVSKPFTIGGTYVLRIEITKPIFDLFPPMKAERLHCVVEMEGARIGTLELPICDGSVPAYSLSDAIASEFAWPIIGRFFEHTVYRELRIEHESDGISIYRGELCLANGLPDSKGLLSCIHDRIGWTIFLQELWDRPDWPADRFNDPMFEQEPTSRRKVTGFWAPVEVTEELHDLKAPKSAREIKILPMVGGCSLGTVSLPVTREVVRAQKLRTAVTACGFELCKVAVREAILGQPLEGQDRLRVRLRAAAKSRRKTFRLKPRKINFAPNWRYAVSCAAPDRIHAVLLAHRAVGEIGTSASRRVVFSASVADQLIEAANASGEPVYHTGGSGQEPGRVVYVPELLWMPQKSPTTAGRNPANAGSDIRRLSHTSTGSHTTGTTTDRLPILMYHRIAPVGSSAAIRYRVTPETFQEQLKYLYDAGFYTIRLTDWYKAMTTYTPLPGRAMILTFDDGYFDFYTYAWPILRQFHFSAIVFLVAEEIGRTNRWDRIHEYGEDVPLLGWAQIRQLQDAGIEFGSHSATHRYLTALSLEEIVREGASSRAILERGLGRPVTAFAYPHGAEDRVIQHLIGGCGYIFGLSTRSGLSRFSDPLLSLPRVEVTGSQLLQDFIQNLPPLTKLSAT